LVENTEKLEKFINTIESIPACISVERGIMWDYLYKEA
jgi:hypothetical protein